MPVLGPVPLPVVQPATVQSGVPKFKDASFQKGLGEPASKLLSWMVLTRGEAFASRGVVEIVSGGSRAGSPVGKEASELIDHLKEQHRKKCASGVG